MIWQTLAFNGGFTSVDVLRIGLFKKGAAHDYISTAFTPVPTYRCVQVTEVIGGLQEICHHKGHFVCSFKDGIYKGLLPMIPWFRMPLM